MSREIEVKGGKKSYTLVPDPKVFDKSLNAGESGAVKLNANISSALATAEQLDRFDDYAALRLPVEAYEAEEGDSYGIVYDNVKHGRSGVILPHQAEAAKRFLQELRGFGLLADVVGSGKTFEAGVVLSELAVRGRIQSMLFIVPQQVTENWIDVMENKFGLGKGVLQKIKTADEIGRNVKKVTEFPGLRLNRPIRPILVEMEEFSKWTESDIKDLLFDVIIVDEAHNLCIERGDLEASLSGTSVDYSNAMYLLSVLMKNKQKTNFRYCLLLSATPHSGNLDKMFRLWYFIRCHGGTPEDFLKGQGQRHTAEYLAERDHYVNGVCRGAHTVSEYIVKSRAIEIEFDAEMKKACYAYLRRKDERKREMAEEDGVDVRSVGNARWPFAGKTNKEIENILKKTSEGERDILYKLFLDDNPDRKKVVTERIARSYHNTVMRSIMIRQKNGLPNKRFVKNIYLVPAKDAGEKRDYSIEGSRKTVVLEPRKVGTDEADKAIYYDGKYYSTDTFSEEYLEKGIFDDLQSLREYFEEHETFVKDNSFSYYRDQIPMEIATEEEKKNRFILLPDYRPGDGYKRKIALLKDILKKNKKRILVFFDYDLSKKNPEACQWEQVGKDLRADAILSKRLIMATADNVEESKTAFDEKEDAVMIVCDRKYTEGANLQKSNMLINFQVTPDPLAMDQRIGRIFRLGQQSDVVIYSFAEADKLEGYALAYYNRIGLMDSNSGDATIIAGCNSERMVAVQCPACGKVIMYALEDYSKYKSDFRQNRSKENPLCCRDSDPCRNNQNGYTLMREINISEFQCDNSACGEKFRRDEDGDGYVCMASTGKGRMANDADSKERRYRCHKLCTLRHCKRFIDPRGELYGKCAVLKEAEKTKNDYNIARFTYLCSNCPERKSGACFEKCNFFDAGEDILGCGECRYAKCSPKPHEIVFSSEDDNWVAPCPKCKTGRLHKIMPHTFATYIKTIYEFKGGNGTFCDNLAKEADKVYDIREILRQDDNEER